MCDGFYAALMLYQFTIRFQTLLGGGGFIKPAEARGVDLFQNM